MGFIEQNLLPDEQIIYRTRKHFIIFLIPAFLAIMIFFFLLNDNPFIVKFAIVPAIGAIITGLNSALIYFTAEFVITNKRILMKEGFFFRHTNETRLATIANVTVMQNLLGQLLNYGSLSIHAFGGEADSFTQISSPNVFQKELQIQLDKVSR